MNTLPIVWGTMFSVLLATSPMNAQVTINITGTVTDNYSTPLQGVAISLKNNPSLSATTDTDGKYSLIGQLSTASPYRPLASGSGLRFKGGSLVLTLAGNSQHVSIALFSMNGKKNLAIADKVLKEGSYAFSISDAFAASSVTLVVVTINGRKTVVKMIYVDGTSLCSIDNSLGGPGTFCEIGAAAAAAVDTLQAAMTGYDAQGRSIDAFTGVYDFVLANNAIKYSSSTVALPVRTTLSASHTVISNYGIKPQIVLIGNSDNSFDVGLYASTASQLQVVRFDSNGTKVSTIVPGYITGATALVGLTRVTDDGSFVAGYAKNNAYGDPGFEYWISRFSTAGTEMFSTRIFGDRPSTEGWAKGEPGTFSSGRMLYNPTSKKIGFYCGHTMKWDDSVRHQGGFVGFMTLTGAFDTANGWFFSHNFDMRMLVVDSCYYLLAHGDAYPRALGFSKWNDVSPRGKKLVDSNYFKISGAVGNNATRTQTGGFVRLSDGNFGVVFASSDSSVGSTFRHLNYDVCFKKISGTGKTLATTWLTAYPATTFAIFPRIALYGSCIMIAWEEVTANTPAVQVQVLDNAGNTVLSKKPVAKAALSPFYDFVTIPRGDILWATLKGSDSLMIHRIAK